MTIGAALEERLSLSGKTAVVTGAASGIGRATARLMCGLGARTAFLDRDTAGLATAVAECAALPGEAL
ncbi:SDR family NAD(P)-dependent oxidoreductase, partial [Acinetobacter baumannii]